MLRRAFDFVEGRLRRSSVDGHDLAGGTPTLLHCRFQGSRLST